MDDRAPKDYVDEAGYVRRWSGGDHQTGTNNNKASIEGGAILALVAIVIACIAVGLVWYTNSQNVALVRDLAAEASAAGVRADIAERRANIAEVYAKQVYVELNRLGYPVQTPAEEHSVAPVEVYQQEQSE